MDSSFEELMRRPYEPATTAVDDDKSIGRRALRAALLAGLDDVIRWGQPVESYRTLTRGGVRVTTGGPSGGEVDASLLVGADGRSSTVRRRLVPDAEPERIGTASIAGRTSLADARAVGLPAAVLDGAGFAIGPEGHNMFLSAHDTSVPSSPDLPPLGTVAAVHEEPHVLWALGADVEKWAVDPRGLEQDRLPAAAAAMLDGWGELPKALVGAADPGSLYPLTFWAAPEIEPWPTVASVTVLGDAVHVMPPTGGIGASTALRDAAALSRALGLVHDGLADPTAALHAYEADMLRSGHDAVTESLANLKRADTLDGPVAFRVGKAGLHAAGRARSLFRALSG